MIREIFVLVLVMILLAGCTSSQPAESGTLQLTSSPSGAEIYLGNQYRGTTPGTITDIAPGNHTLEFRSQGYTSWKGVVSVPPGTSNYFAALTAKPGTAQEISASPVATAVPAAVTVQVSSAQMIVGDSNTFSGTAAGTRSIALTLSGPGYYTNGVVLGQIIPGATGTWSYTWNPGTAVQSGAYTITVRDADKTVSDHAQFTVIGNGKVTVSPSSYAVLPGDTLTFSGICTTGASTVQLTLSGPDRFATSVNLGMFPVTADKTWSYRYTIDRAAPVGIYTVYVTDLPKTASSSYPFTVRYDN